jgi:selenocysteine lyase/cysteine desulfurase
MPSPFATFANIAIATIDTIDNIAIATIDNIAMAIATIAMAIDNIAIATIAMVVVAMSIAIDQWHHCTHQVAAISLNAI